MFYVSKLEVPRYWLAWAGHVEEHIGFVAGNDNEFESEQSARAYAETKLTQKLERDFISKDSRYSAAYLVACNIRALWDDSTRKGLVKYRVEVEQARQALRMPLVIRTALLPDQIPMKGERIAIGTTVYFLDSHNATIVADKVEREVISYYRGCPEGVSAYYVTENGRSCNSELSTNYTNQEVYLDKQVAIARIRVMAAERAQRLNEQLKNL